MKIFKIFIALIVVCALGVHGYFYAEYSTANPCTAAVERIKRDFQAGNIGEQLLGLGMQLGQDVGFQKDMESEIGKKGIHECYKIGLLGASKN